MSIAHEGRDRVEHVRKASSTRQDPRRLHVAGLAGRAVRRDHDPGARRPQRRGALNNFYVANFKDYRFLQVFYPTRGILAWYSRDDRETAAAARRRRPALRADQRRLEPRREVPRVRPRRGARRLSRRAASWPSAPTIPNETQIQYDLYRIPFNGGKGGAAGAHRRRVAQRHEQHLPEGLARRPLDRLRPVPQRPADAPRQPALHRSGRTAARRAG